MKESPTDVKYKLKERDLILKKGMFNTSTSKFYTILQRIFGFYENFGRIFRFCYPHFPYHLIQKKLEKLLTLKE